MSRTARFTLDPAFTVGEVDPRLFGSFVEHLGRCVYTGIYEPGHPTADEAGLRTDVLELVRELGVTAIRYPGGNFVSGYQLGGRRRPRRGAPPPPRPGLALDRDQPLRPRRVHRLRAARPAGRADDGRQPRHPRRRRGPRAPGVRQPPGRHRPVRPARRARRQGPVRHQAVVPGQRDGRPLADRPQDRRGVRPARRRDRPRDAADRPGRRTRRLRQLQPAACRPSPRGRRRSSQETYDLVDYISLHAYYEEHDGDRDSFLASAVDMESFIENVVATCDHVGARLKSKKKINLSFDEWNVWYMSRCHEIAGAPPQDWPEAPRAAGGQLHRHRRRRLRLAAHRPAAPRRPRHRRLPRPARQRHRARS